jgi:general secretion pathway protein C
MLVAQELPARDSTVIPEAGAAIIAVGRNPQQTYWTGDTIKDIGNTTLYLVFADRVLLDRGGGRYEALYYKPDDGSRQALQPNSRVSQRTETSRAAPVEPSTASSVADELSGVASTLLQHVTMAQAIEGGNVIGMRLQPRGDGQIFAQLGFEPGDILLDVNGLSVIDLRSGPALSQALTETNQASVRVQRNGTVEALIVNFNDIQQLTESLQ